MGKRGLLLATLLTLSACSRGGAPAATGSEAAAVLVPSAAARRAVAGVMANYHVRAGAGGAAFGVARAVAADVPVAVLREGVADRFESTAKGIVPRFPDHELVGVRQGAVVLPARADGTLHLTDVNSRVSLAATLIGARPAIADAADGVLFYRGGYAGFDLFHRPTAEGTEDFVHFATAPPRAEVGYTVELGAGAVGLRLVANTLEVIDAAGAPRLRMASPYLVDAAGTRHAATIAVAGCAIDTSPAAPWGRAPVAPGAGRCEVRVAWADAPVQYPALLDPAWNATGMMSATRGYHQQLLMTNGIVLAAGGQSPFLNTIATCDLYNPGTGTWAATGSLATARYQFAMVQLLTGKVLAAGGLGGPIVATTELYDPATGVWSPSGNLNTPRFSHAVFRLTAGPNVGKALAVGGRIQGQVGISSCELYDPALGTWGAANPINTARGFDFAAATSLSDGSPLIAGGATPGQNFLASVEKFDQAAGTWSFVASLNNGRQVFTLNRISDGKVLAAGGSTSGGDTATAELYDPAGNTWTFSGSFPDGARTNHTGTALSGNRVLITGGANPGFTSSTLLWSEATGVWLPSGNLLFNTSDIYAQTALTGSSVLVSGGGGPGATTNEAQIFTPLANGGACTQPGECISGFCVDGVCCNTACGGGAADCQACSIAAGAPADGTCAPLTGLPCNDGVACTLNDKCTAGVCAGVSALACAGACGPAVGCGYVDTDSDGLNDTWETNGYVDINCNGVNDVGVDTPLPGANVNEPDVYVKWDYMVKAGAGAHSHQPTAAAMALVQTAFSNHHSHLHYFPTSDSIAEQAVVTLADPAAIPGCAGGDAVSLYTLKAAHFGMFLRPAYHYTVFAHFNTCDSAADCATCPVSAKSGAPPPFGASGIAELPGNDFIVSLGQLVDLGVSPMPDLVNAGTFMHELGHNISLHHGGTDDIIQKPNYFSVMNYTYQNGIGTAAPGPYDTSTVDPSTSYYVDYSRFAAGSLREGMTSGANTCISDGSGGMSEPAGISGGGGADTDVTVFYADAGGTTLYAPSNGTAVDWDNAAPATDTVIYADVSGDGACNVLTGFTDWAQSMPAAGVFVDTNLSIGFQCNTGFWADGAPPPAQIEDRELTGTQIFDSHKAYPFKRVSVDVRPGCATNWIALSGPGNVPVAALGSASFDVSLVVPASLRFAGAAAASTSISDVNGDGFADITGQFPMASLHLNLQSTHGDLTGALRSSQAFGGRDTVTFVPLPGPDVTTRADDIYEDEPAFDAIEKKLKQCTDPPVMPFRLSDCVDTVIDHCGNSLGPNAAGQITRIEFWSNIRAKDAADPKKQAEALKHAQERFDHAGCAKFGITSNSTANLPFDELDDLEGRSSYYKVYFTESDSYGDSTAGSCVVNLYGSHKEQAELAGKPGEQAVSLGCAVCIGTDCGGCAAPAIACDESTRECNAAREKCAARRECNDYQKKCTATCR